MPRKCESRGTYAYRGQFIPKRSVRKDLDKRPERYVRPGRARGAAALRIPL